MATVVITGVLYQPFGSFPSVTTSTDGVTWAAPVSPFDAINISPSCISTDGSNVVIGSSNGKISVTSDLYNFSFSEIPGGFHPSDMQLSDTWFVSCGQIIYTQEYGPYPAMSEVAQIYRTENPRSSWTMVWSHPLVNSRFYQLKKIPIGEFTALVACGSVEGKGDAWYSIDEGFSWTQVTVPSGVGPILSVDSIELNNTRYYYWGSNGSLYRSTSMHDTEWTGISVDENDNIVEMVNNGVTLVILGQHTVYHTNDGVYLKKWTQPGYVFNHASYVNGSLVVFGQSILTRYTQWITTDFVEWTPSNNGLHVNAVTFMT